jgi:hypothetical protein
MESEEFGPQRLEFRSRMEPYWHPVRTQEVIGFGFRDIPGTRVPWGNISGPEIRGP